MSGHLETSRTANLNPFFRSTGTACSADNQKESRPHNPGACPIVPGQSKERQQNIAPCYPQTPEFSRGIKIQGWFQWILDVSRLSVFIFRVHRVEFVNGHSRG